MHLPVRGWGRYGPPAALPVTDRVEQETGPLPAQFWETQALRLLISSSPHRVGERKHEEK